MRPLGFAAGQVEDGELAVSELATNAYTYASMPGRACTVAQELWIWARTYPTPELVVSVFDSHRDTWPVTRDVELLDEHGKGLSIVGAVSSSTGTHLTRSRMTAAPGKCVWFTLPLPAIWQIADRAIPPIFAACRLSDALKARGIPTTYRRDGNGATVLSTRTLNIWVAPNAFTWPDSHGYIRQPLIDLQETAERITSHYETHHSAPRI
ncbi:ATP-binding protein [Actinomadura chokoriensis]|uniref:ATP-binding protein n=2 Tax=Actinomadura chokoriensis TaxID=454156 RepID=A0ABV4QV37_9ACTN